MLDIDLNTLKDGGAIVLAGLLILYSAFKDKIYNKTINNHLQHVEMALHKFATVTEKMVTQSERSEKILDRLERKLDK